MLQQTEHLQPAMCEVLRPAAGERASKEGKHRRVVGSDQKNTRVSVAGSRDCEGETSARVVKRRSSPKTFKGSVPLETQINEHFERDPMCELTVKQMTFLFSACSQSVHTALRRIFQKPYKKIRIAKWIQGRRGGTPYAVYAYGTDPDVKRPKGKLTQSQKSKRYRERMKLERPEDYEMQLDKYRVRRRKTAVFGDPILATLMGFVQRGNGWVPRNGGVQAPGAACRDTSHGTKC